KIEQIIDSGTLPDLQRDWSQPGHPAKERLVSRGLTVDGQPLRRLDQMQDPSAPVAKFKGDRVELQDSISVRESRIYSGADLQRQNLEALQTLAADAESRRAANADEPEVAAPAETQPQPPQPQAQTAQPQPQPQQPQPPVDPLAQE